MLLVLKEVRFNYLQKTLKVYSNFQNGVLCKMNKTLKY